MLVFRYWLAEGIAQISYLVGDDGTHTAAVIDPRPEPQIYVEAAREMGVAITHVFETHVHADFMSGSRELAQRVGNAAICVSGESGAKYGFAVDRLVREGDTFEFGSAVLRVRHTPGHTPEHVAYEVCDAKEPERPWGVFTGDSLFVDSAGRPDLLGEKETEGLVRKLYETLRGYYLKLPDDVIIYPCHGKGSACGPAIGERLTSTIGYERTHNRFLLMKEFEQFREAMLGDAPPAPTHYPRLKKVNAAGPEILGAGPVAPALPPKAFAERLERGGAQLVDSRDMLAFGGGHIPGAINIGANKPEMSVYAGWVLDAEKPILLVLQDDTDLERVVQLLVRTGLTKFAGYLAGGMMAWDNAGLPLRRVRQMQAREVAESDGTLQRLDVRQDREWRRGHVPGAVHEFVAELAREGEKRGLRKDWPVVTYCATGYRASLAASLLQRAGFEDVRNMPGSWHAWRAAGLQEEK